MTEIDDRLTHILNSFDCMKAYLKVIAKRLEVVEQNEKWRRNRTEVILSGERSIAAGGSYMTTTIPSEMYNRCRIEIGAGFTPASSMGIGVLLIYQNAPVGKVFDIIATNGAAIARSEAIDIKELSGFQFELHNRDTINALTIKQIKAVLYNDGV